jgi:hypothetical protein
VGKTRLEAFSDGVLAIVITIMVLEMKVPHDASPAGLAPLLPVFLSYVLSFVYIGIYCNQRGQGRIYPTAHRLRGQIFHNASSSIPSRSRSVHHCGRFPIDQIRQDQRANKWGQASPVTLPKPRCNIKLHPGYVQPRCR